MKAKMQEAQDRNARHVDAAEQMEVTSSFVMMVARIAGGNWSRLQGGFIPDPDKFAILLSDETSFQLKECF